MSIKDCLLNKFKINKKKKNVFIFIIGYSYRLTAELFGEHELKIQIVRDIRRPDNQSGFLSRYHIYVSYVQIYICKYPDKAIIIKFEEFVIFVF